MNRLAAIAFWVAILITQGSPATGALIDFEGFYSPPENPVTLSNQLPGVVFVGEAWVMDPAQVGSEVPISGASSGTGAALLDAFAILRFRTPVVRISAKLTVGHSSLADAGPWSLDAVAYDALKNERVRTRVELVCCSSNSDELAAIRPQEMVISSSVPIKYLDFRGRSSMFMDDLTFTPASAQLLAQPLPPPTQWPSGSFEGLADPGETDISMANAVAGAQFLSENPGFVFDPAPPEAVTSGYAAARTFSGTAWRFYTPISEFSVNVAPYDGPFSNRLDIVGYDINLKERVRTTTYITQLQSVNLISKVPLGYVGFFHNGNSFFCDDVTYTLATPEAISAPLPPVAERPPGSFEGLVPPWTTYVRIGNQIPNVIFDANQEPFVSELAYVWNSTAIPVPATSSGTAAMRGGGSMRFIKPVTRLSLYVTPYGLALNGVSVVTPVQLVGYNAELAEIARSGSVSLPFSAATAEQIQAITPQKLEIASAGPMTYVRLVGDHTDVWIDDLTLKLPEYTIALEAAPAADGFVAEKNEFANVGGFAYSLNAGPAALRAGDTGLNQQLKAIVSFNSRLLPANAEIVSAKLWLKAGAIYGNPFGQLGQCRLELNGPACFSGSIALQPSDFQALPTKSNAGILLRESADSDWFVANLDPKCFTALKGRGRVQFRLSFDRQDNNDLAPDYVGWYSADHATPENRPALEVTYR